MADDRELQRSPASTAEVRATRTRGKQTIRRLLQAGREALEEVGYADLRVDDVVKRAGTSHGTFYLYFSDKGDLLDALGTDLTHDLSVIADSLPNLDADDESRAQLQTWLTDVLRLLNAQSGVLKALISADPEWDWRLLTSSLEGTLTRRLDAAHGATPGLPSEHAAWACAAMIIGLGTGAPTDLATQASITRMLHRALVASS